MSATQPGAVDDAQDPPVISATSPFHELLIQDVVASVPADLGDHLEKATTVAELNDWLAAGAMFRWIGSDQYLRRVFLGALNGKPSDAALALAQTVAARMEPPRPSREWRAADRDGLYLQLAVVIALLSLRAALVGWLAGPWPALALHTLHFWLSSVVDWPLLASGAPANLLTLVCWLHVVFWHACEIRYVPPVLEWGRTYPARLRGLPPPRSWRIDTFDIVWRLQAGVLWGIAVYQSTIDLVNVAVTGMFNAAMLAGVVAFFTVVAWTGRQVMVTRSGP